MNTPIIDIKNRDVGYVGHEINLNFYSLKYSPLEPLEKIKAETRTLEKKIAYLLGEAIS